MPDLDLDLIEPLCTHREPGPRYQIAEAARLIAGPHDDRAAVARHFREMVKQNIIMIREKSGDGPLSARRFAPSDVMVGYLLRCLNRLGLHDLEVAQRVSVCCYAQGEIGRHAITDAIDASFAPEREFFTLRVDAFSIDGRREVAATLCSDQRPFPELDRRRIPEHAWLHGSTIVPAHAFIPILFAQHADAAARGLH